MLPTVLMIICFSTFSCDGALVQELRTDEIILKNGYPVEVHRVDTPDGFILTLFRIPGDHGSTPVYCQHGLIDSSDSFFAMGRNKSLGFMLHDEGFDVWAGNFRGNDYSFVHRSLSINSTEYWDFSWDTLAEYDVRNMIDYILQVSGQPQLIQIGHSMGTTSFFVAASMFPEVNEKVKLHIALAPVTSFEFSKSPLFTQPFLEPLLQTLQRFQDGSLEGLNPQKKTKLPFGLPSSTNLLNEFVSPVANLKTDANEIFSDFTFVGNFAQIYQNALNHGEIKSLVLRRFCQSNYLNSRICLRMFSTGMGDDEHHLTRKLIQLQFRTMPKSSSLKMVKHYLQQKQAGRVFLYDYGCEEDNLKVYGSAQPPEIDFSKIEVPVYFVYGRNDLLTAEEDVRASYNKLGNPQALIPVGRPDWNHMNFFITKDVDTTLNRRILLKIVNQFK